MHNPRKAPRICGSKVKTGCMTCKYRFPIDFSDPVLRATHSEEGLARAIISFGALQQIYEYGDDPFLLSPLGQFAMREYGQALEEVRVQPGNGGKDLSLVCCLLFACFEFIRGCRRAAVVHIKSGLDILLQYGEELSWDVVWHDTMVSLFIKLDNQLVGLLGTSLSRTLKRDGERGSSILERVSLGPNGDYVVHSLHGVLNSIFHDRLDMALIMEGHPPSVLPADQGGTSRYLKEWHGGQDPDIMRIWYIIGKMYVAVPPDGSEDVWDQFRTEFETIVSLMESYLSHTRQSSPKRTFSFDLGIVSPLYIVGMRCRDMSIRRRAIWLLESCERREILWDSTLTAMAARRVMEFEESRDIWPKSLGRRVRNVTAVLDDDNGVSIEFQ
ncbi:hypothetical protein BDV34DRAFT_211570 [Aspergillus parasiticus]|uniref:Specific transcription factor domain protein n=1 Tax=Aspergillus parasiticus TaxID=5067 RepID=A0A5N6DQX7_ASPPA|nr:hypothetical protein BDV34DRAFT_211570 [Aspergillus parasiticus]